MGCNHCRELILLWTDVLRIGPVVSPMIPTKPKYRGQARDRIVEGGGRL